jgi:hypothetical protein
MEIIILYAECLGASLFGALFHLFLKLDSKAKEAKKLEKVFSAKEYISDEKFALAANVCVQILLLIWMPEIITKYPALEGWLVTMNAMVGYFGSSIAIKVFEFLGNKFSKATEIK